jgi:hypothetical protein
VAHIRRLNQSNSAFLIPFEKEKSREREGEGGGGGEERESARARERDGEKVDRERVRGSRRQDDDRPSSSMILSEHIHL